MIANLQELAQTLFEEAGDALFLFDPADGRVVDVNPTAQRLSGTTRPALLQESVDALFRSEVQGGLARLRRAYQNTGQFHAQDGFFLRQRAAGAWLPVNLTVARLHVRPKTLGLITARDVSERRRAEAALRESEARVRAILASALDCIISIDHRGTITEFNPAAEQTFGYSRPQAIGRPLAELIIPPGAREAHARGLARYLATGERSILGRRIEVPALRADGTEFPVELTVTAGGPAGEPVFTAFLRDITDRRRAEQAVRESEERFRALVEKSFDGILLLDRAGVITYASPSATRILGYAREEFVGRRFSDLVPGGDSGEPADLCGRAGGAAGAGVPACARYRHQDGGWRWLEVRSTDLLAEPGVRATVVNFRDVTEQRVLEEQYRQAQKMEAVGQLAGGVAHDFNNLLTIINGYSDLLLQRLPAGDPGRELLEEIAKAGERSAALTRQLLAFSRQQVVAPKVLDLNAIVTDAGRMLRRVIGEDVRLTTALAPDLGPVRVDAGQVEQVLLNLAVNARDAMPTGGRLTIETRNVDLGEEFARAHPGARPGRHVLLAVSDTGCGMTAEVKARAFEPFFTTKGPGEGTGLGLATVYGIVQQSGGHVEVLSEVGAGTSFHVYLPRADEPARRPATGSHLLPPPRGTETVLLVEDEDGVRALTRHVVAECGYTVLEAADGQEAARVAAAHPGPIHLIVTDVVMPGEGGRLVAERLRDRHPEARVLFVSGYTDDAVVRHGVLSERANFLQKPFSPAALARKVRDVLDAPA